MLTTTKRSTRDLLAKTKFKLRQAKKRRYTRALVAVVVMCAGIVLATQANAQRRKKIVLSEFVIEGRVQKPQAFLLLQRQRLDFEGLQMKQSFVPKILKSVDKKLF